MSTWRERLDARIDRCDCGGWRFDGKCKQCDDDKENAA